MAATFTWNQRYGSSPGTATDLGISGNLFNFKKADDATAANYSSNPINAGDHSYEVWLRGKFTGTFNSIGNFQFWRSTNFSPSTGLAISWGQTSAYATPTSGDSTKATASVPTSDPGAANVGVGANPSGSLSASGFTNYIVLQLDTTTAAAAGDTSLATFTLNYDES